MGGGGSSRRLAGIFGGRSSDGDGDEGRRSDRGSGGPSEGSRAPDFTLTSLSGDAEATLSDFAGDRPVALIFGSYT